MKKKKSKKIALFYRFNINLPSNRQNFILIDNEAVELNDSYKFWKLPTYPASSTQLTEY